MKTLTVLLMLALSSLTVFAGTIDPVSVTYTVSGQPGAWDLNFTVANNITTGPQQDIFQFGVQLSVSDIIGTPPSPYFYAGYYPGPAEYFVYDGNVGTSYNNNWFGADSSDTNYLAQLLSGSSLSGFMVAVPDAVAPVLVPWFVYVTPNSGDPADLFLPPTNWYLGTGSFPVDSYITGFEGTASSDVASPEPATMTMFGSAFIGLALWFSKRHLKKIAILSLCSASVFAADLKPLAGGLNAYVSQIIPMVILGDGWTQRFVLQNVDDKWSSAGQITFFSAAGTPLNLHLNFIGAVNSSIATGSNTVESNYGFTIPQGKTLVLETVATNGPQQLGWATLDLHTTGNTSAGDYSGIGDTFGQTIFRKSTAGLPDFMCSMVFGMKAYHRMSVLFDNTDGNYTGMGIILSDDTTGTADVRVTIRDISGVVISQKVITRTQKTLYWMNLASDFPESNNRIGTFEVEPVDAYQTVLTGVSLQFSGNGAFTIVTPYEN